MKTRLLAIFGLVTGLSLTASAIDIMGTITNFTEKGAESLCKKGQFSFNPFSSEAKYSIRSGDGNACNSKLIAALATYVCLEKNYEDFNKSKCFTIAKGVLGDEVIIKGEDNEIDVPKTVEAAKAVLVKEGQESGGTLFNLVKGILGM